MVTEKVGAVTDQVIKILNLSVKPDTPIYLGESNIDHIRKAHPNDFKKYGGHISDIIINPDYVGLNAKDSSIEYVKSFPIDDEFVKVAVRVTTKNKMFVRSMYILNNNRVNLFISRGTLKSVKKF